MTRASTSHDALAIAAAGTRQILPDSEGVFDAISRIGYEFEHAVADLIDNSVDAKAANVLVRFIHDGRSVQSVSVIDDGNGMTGPELDTAMAFGARTGKGDDSLGKYGMGLKSASFSQCEVLTVITSSNGIVQGRRWTAEKARCDWLCEILRSSAAASYLRGHADRVAAADHGTLVEWNRLDALSHSMQRPERMIETRFQQLSNHLGLVFHRFLEDRRLRIRMDAFDIASGLRGFAQDIEPLNPFPKITGLAGYPREFSFSVPGGPAVSFRAYIWRRNAGDAGFKLGGGRLAKRQGIYVYRNDRLIQAGGWNGLRNDAEVHSSLARIEFNLPASLDAVFKPTVQKSAVSMPEEILEALREARSGTKRFADYLADAEQAYRDQKPEKMTRHGLVPTTGITKELALRFERILGEAQDDEDEVRFVWSRLGSSELVDVEASTNTIYLNSDFREAVLQGTRASSGDAPLVKTLLMLLFQEDLARRNRMASFAARLAVINELLIEAVRAQR
ncbi:MAG: ATP-binding protein [Acidimicrobiales bacterium]